MGKFYTIIGASILALLTALFFFNSTSGGKEPIIPSRTISTESTASSSSSKSKDTRTQKTFTPEEPLELKEWEKNYLGDLIKPYDPDLLRALLSQEHYNSHHVMQLLCRAAVEKDDQFQNLITREDLLSKSDIRLGLLAYDYTLNSNQDAFDQLIKAVEKSGGDSIESVVLSHVDEWEISFPLMKDYFRGADGAAAEAYYSYWVTRKYLYPKKYRKWNGPNEKFPQ